MTTREDRDEGLPPEPASVVMPRPSAELGAAHQQAELLVRRLRRRPRCPTIRPSNITAIRSPTAMTSSSSVLTIRIAAPASRCSTSRRWMYSIEPTSRPRVGCAARTSFTGHRELARDDDLLLVAARQRARQRLDRRRADVELLDALSRAFVDGLAVRGPRAGCTARGGRCRGCSSRRPSSSAISPSRPRSSGMWATPRSETSRGVAFSM